MFVQTREAIEDREGISLGGRRNTLVRLSFLDQCSYRPGYTSDPWSTYYLEVAGISEDRELTPALALLGDCVNGMVKGGPEILECFSNEQGPVRGSGLLLDCEDAVFDLLRRSDVSLYTASVGIRVLKGAGFLAKSVDVFYAPSELQLGRGLSHEVPSHA